MEGGNAGWHPRRQPPAGPRRVAEEGALSPVAGTATIRTGATPSGGRRRAARPRGARRAWRRRPAATTWRAGAAEVRPRRRGRFGRAGEGERALRERKRRKEGEWRGDIFTQHGYSLADTCTVALYRLRRHFLSLLIFSDTFLPAEKRRQIICSPTVLLPTDD